MSLYIHVFWGYCFDSFSSVCLFCPITIFLFILLYFINIILPMSIYVLTLDRKGRDLDVREGRKGLRGIERGKAIIKI